MKATSEFFFDDTLGRLVETLRTTLSDEVLDKGVILRDASGRLTFISPFKAPSEEEREKAAQELCEALGYYARRDRVLAFSDDPGAEQLLRDPSRLPVEVNGVFCQVVDRRIVGSGWLDQPQEEISYPPRFVFASLKGGVGRSTAIAIAAADLARRNKNVLVIDLDLEAPGLGVLLLDEDRMPRFGTVDFLVENGIGGVPDRLVDDFIGASTMTTGDGGRVDVVPAFGSKSILNPENILPKLARAMIEDIASDGGSVSVSAQIGTMIGRLTARNSYDVVLIESRAGLAELAAPAVLGLGATVLLFGTAQNQTIQGYRALFAGLKLLAQRDRVAGRKAEWRLLFKAIYAKASFDGDVGARYRDDLFELFADYLYDSENAETDGDGVSFDIDDESAPHWPLMIPFNQGFIDFDPTHSPSQLATAFYEQAFRPFLDGLDAMIAAASPAAPTEGGGGSD